MAKIKNIDYWKEQLVMCEQMPEQMMTLKGWSKNELEKNIADLKKKISHSKRGKSSKRKGASYENKVGKKFLDKWGIKLVRTPASGGFHKDTDNDLIRGDLSCLDPEINLGLHIECKDQKTWSLKSWWKQALEDCPRDDIPLVIYHQRQENKDGKRVQEADDFVMLRLEDFLEIVDQPKVVVKEEQKNDAKRDTGRTIARKTKKVKPRIQRKNL